MGILYRPERLQDIQHSYGVGSDQCNAQVVTFAFDPVKACGESGDEQYPRRQIFDHLHNLLRFTALVSFDQILRADRAVWMLLTDLLKLWVPSGSLTVCRGQSAFLMGT